MSKRHNTFKVGVTYSELKEFCEGIGVKLVSSEYDLVQNNRFSIEGVSDSIIGDVEIYVMDSGNDVVDIITRGGKATYTIY